MEVTDLNIVIGLVGAPVLIWMLTGHIKQFSYGLPFGTKPENPEVDCSPWPLVVDVIAVLWTLGLWDAGLLAEITPDDLELRWTTVVMLGLALGVSTSRLYSKLDPRAEQVKEFPTTPFSPSNPSYPRG